jgi:predicted RND superfamily exporter protein
VTNLILLPVLLSYFGVNQAAAERSVAHASAGEAARGFARLWAGLGHFSERRRALVAIGVAAALTACGYVVSLGLKIGDLDAGAPELRADSRYNRDNAYITGHYTLSSDTFAVIVKTPKEGCLKYETLVEADRLAWSLQQLPGVQTTVSLADAVRQITAGSNEGSPKWLTIARNQDVLNYGAQQASVNNPELFNTDCSVMPVIAYLSDHRAETLDRVVQASAEFAGAHNTDERSFLLAAGSAGIDAATNIVVKKAWTQMLLLVYAAYFALRAAVDGTEKRASLSAVYAILALPAMIFLMFVLPRITVSPLHPNNTLSTRDGLGTEYRIVLSAAMFGFLGLYVWMFRIKTALAEIRLKKRKY